MKKLILIYFSILTPIIYAQTELIAYKSHSGNMINYKLTGFDNLGNPPMDRYLIIPDPITCKPKFPISETIFLNGLNSDSIVKINDSTIITYYTQKDYQPLNKDSTSLINHPICSQDLNTFDSLDGKYFYNGIVLINFEKYNKTIKDSLQTDSIIKIDDILRETMHQNENINSIPTINKNETPPSIPYKNSITIEPINNLYILWLVLFGFVIIFSLTLWFKFKPKLQV